MAMLFTTAALTRRPLAIGALGARGAAPISPVPFAVKEQWGTRPHARDTSEPRRAGSGLRAAVVAGLCCALASAPHARNQLLSESLTQAQVKAQYQNCPNGYYSGPRPGKARYTKDKWVWAVTPEFARKFCMPPEFVSTELKGAEAVAYKMVVDEDEERCGWGGNAEVCNKRTEHRFEIYYRNGTIPKKREVPYSHAANLPSRMLISVEDRERRAKIKSLETKPRLGAIGVFDSEQFGLEALGEKKVVWPLGGLSAEIYYEEIFEGIDYLALEGASGFSHQEGWIKSGVKNFAITVERVNEPRRSTQIPLNEFALLIHLPGAMVDRIIANDQARGTNLKALAQEAMRPSTTTKH